ncbi:MAG: hypothetical protein WDN44_12675 [Sphingomonas sp.]
MRRLLLGSVAAGAAMWLVGFVFWGPLLGWIPFSSIPDSNAALLQQALKANLGPTGTGVYLVPTPATTIGTGLYANGPVALVHYSNTGFPAFDTASLLWGLLLAVVCALVMGFGLRSVTANLGFAARLKLVALFAVAIAGYADLGQPIFNHAPWGYFVYAFVADVATWLAAGAVLARWFMPGPGAPKAAPGSARRRRNRRDGHRARGSRARPRPIARPAIPRRPAPRASPSRGPRRPRSARARRSAIR